MFIARKILVGIIQRDSIVRRIDLFVDVVVLVTGIDVQQRLNDHWIAQFIFLFARTTNRAGRLSTLIRRNIGDRIDSRRRHAIRCLQDQIRFDVDQGEFHLPSYTHKDRSTRISPHHKRTKDDSDGLTNNCHCLQTWLPGRLWGRVNTSSRVMLRRPAAVSTKRRRIARLPLHLWSLTKNFLRFEKSFVPDQFLFWRGEKNVDQLRSIAKQKERKSSSFYFRWRITLCWRSIEYWFLSMHWHRHEHSALDSTFEEDWLSLDHPAFVSSLFEESPWSIDLTARKQRERQKSSSDSVRKKELDLMRNSNRLCQIIDVSENKSIFFQMSMLIGRRAAFRLRFHRRGWRRYRSSRFLQSI